MAMDHPSSTSDYRNHCPETKAGNPSTGYFLLHQQPFLAMVNTLPQAAFTTRSRHSLAHRLRFRLQHASESKEAASPRDHRRSRVPHIMPTPLHRTHSPPSQLLMLLLVLSGEWGLGQNRITPGCSQRGAPGALACLVGLEPAKTE